MTVGMLTKSVKSGAGVQEGQIGYRMEWGKGRVVTVLADWAWEEIGLAVLVSKLAF